MALKALLKWLKDSGRSIAWLARVIDRSYQTTWNKLHGVKPLTDDFVIRCFSRLRELPPNVFEAHGYWREGNQVVKSIPLPPAERAQDGSPRASSRG